MKQFKLKIAGNDYEVKIKDYKENEVLVDVNGVDYRVGVEEEVKAPVAIVTPKKTSTPKLTPVKPKKSGADKDEITAPLPGTILKINCKEGDKVQRGQDVVILEAMKMQNEIQSVFAGTVTKVHVKEGDNVLEGDVLITISEK